MGKEFFGLHLPVEAEVLDLCAGSGIVSANIQSRGFINVDALDEDMPTLRKLQAKNLYRNYIWREVSGIGSTGIREESYDVVITAGGFSSHALSPNDITEVLRILKPDGYMLWTMKTAQEEHLSEFGLFEQNLNGFVKTGKCQIVKHENFDDSRSRLKRPWWTAVILHILSSSMMHGVRSSVMTWLLLVTTMGISSVQRPLSSLV